MSDVDGETDMVLFTQDHVPDVDIAGGRIIIAASDGLFKPAGDEPDAENESSHD